MSQGGTYTLLISLPESDPVEVGALGIRDFEAGWYAYTGSALGPGGFSRVDRHRELANGERDARHWHVDYLLGETTAGIEAVWRTPGEDRECEIAAAVPGDPIPAFGASDCSCDSHLAFASDRSPIADALDRLHAGRFG